MTATLQLENVDGTVVVNLLNSAGVRKLLDGTGRPLTADETHVTRTFTFLITGTSKADARNKANLLVASLRQAMDWHDDNLERNSVFLREGNDGETAVRSLITKVKAEVVNGLGLSIYQDFVTESYVRAAITTLRRSEEAAYSSAVATVVSGLPGALGSSYLISGLNHTDDSRMKLIVSSGQALERVWMGIKQYEGADFQPIWKFENYTGLWNTTTTTTTTGSYGTNVVNVAFSNTQMLRRAAMTLANIYAAASSTNYAHAKGEFMALLRYRTTGAGTFLARLGSTYFSETAVSYNEPRVLPASTDWRFAQMGVMKFPARGHRFEINLAFLFNTTQVILDAQRLSGSANLHLDSITWIPYKHFVHITDLVVGGSGNSFYLVTHEDGSAEAYSTSGATLTQYGTIREQRNWLMPPIKNTFVQLVMAGERGSTQVYNDTMTLTSANIYKAYEAYHA